MKYLLTLDMWSEMTLFSKFYIAEQGLFTTKTIICLTPKQILDFALLIENF